MSKTLQLNIVLPETPMPTRTVSGLDLPADGGRLSVWANHQPIIAALIPGSMTIILETGQRERWTISAGALQVENNVATLLVRDATQTLTESNS